MKNKCLKLFIGLFTVVLVLAGCSSPNSEKASNGKKTITVMASGVKQADQKVFIELFKEIVEKNHSDITVETTLLPDDQYYTALKSKLSTGQPPDLFLVQPKRAGANSVTEMANAGYIENLSNYAHWDDIVDSAKTDMSYDGNPYAIPNAINLLGTWYNKTLFEKYNLAIPTNWSEFLAVCETLKSNGITPIVMGDKDSYMIQFGMYQIAANQVYPKNPTFDDELYDGKTKFTDNEWEKTITMYKELYDKGYVSEKSLGLGQAQSQQTFLDGDAAMTFDGDFSAPTLQSAKDFDAGFFALPANDEGEPVYLSAATGAGYALSSKSEYKDEIKEILNEMTDGQSELFDAWINDSKSIKVYKGAQPENPVFEDAVKLYDTGNASYWCNQAWPAGTETEMQAKFSEMIGTGKISPKDVVESMQKKFEELSK